MVILKAKQLVPARARPSAKALYWRTLPRARKREHFARSFRRQGALCLSLGSPLYAELLERAGRDIEDRGPCWAVLEAARPTAVGADDALPLRFMAGVHRLVLAGEATSLARHFPSAGGTVGDDPWPAFSGAVSTNIDALREALRRPVQTNEVRRCAALVGGFLLAGRPVGGRLRVLELGASAGLNLRWDRYRYEAEGDSGWGDPTSPVRLDDVFVESTPLFHLRAEVVQRAGCDLAPLDASSPEDSLALAAFVWPDQTKRLRRLEAALEMARRYPVRVDVGNAPQWLEGQLESEVDGVATVVFHSFFEQYLTDMERARLREILVSAGRRATMSAPLAHLRMEWGRDGAHVELTSWPGGSTRLLATADNQGGSIRWRAS